MAIKEALWVKATEIKRLTGWNDNTMYKYRQLKCIRYEKRKTVIKKDGTSRFGYVYDLNSVDERLYKYAVKNTGL